MELMTDITKLLRELAADITPDREAEQCLLSAADRIEELEAKVERLNEKCKWLETWRGTIEPHVAAERKRLLRWVRHHDDCGSSLYSPHGGCTCGLAAALGEDDGD